jgi:hypothetical protein
MSWNAGISAAPSVFLAPAGARALNRPKHMATNDGGGILVVDFGNS